MVRDLRLRPVAAHEATMPGSYSFAVDQRHDLLKITFAGFFCTDDLVGYVAAKRVAMAALHCPPNWHVTLCDFTACVPQSPAVLDLFRASLADPATRSRRLAIVVGSMLASMQVQRIVTRSDASVFQSASAAVMWLLDEPAVSMTATAAIDSLQRG